MADQLFTCKWEYEILNSLAPYNHVTIIEEGEDGTPRPWEHLSEMGRRVLSHPRAPLVPLVPRVSKMKP